jgi:hypothetical protein
MVRKFWYEANVDHITDGSGRLQTEQVAGIFKVMLESGDTGAVNLLRHYEYLPAPFAILRNVVLPVGGYRFNELMASYQLGPQRGINGTITASGGSFYSGNHTGLAYQGRAELTKQLSVEPRVSVDWVTLPQGDFTTELASARTMFNMTPRMFVAALIQYNSSASSFETNIRFRWEYQPGSDLFVVYGVDRGTTSPAIPVLQNRSFVVKYTRLFRF